ncbi:unnamed protein product [Caretta caretta]
MCHYAVSDQTTAEIDRDAKPLTAGEMHEKHLAEQCRIKCWKVETDVGKLKLDVNLETLYIVTGSVTETPLGLSPDMRKLPLSPFSLSSWDSRTLKTGGFHFVGEYNWCGLKKGESREEYGTRTVLSLVFEIYFISEIEDENGKEMDKV